MGDFHFPFKSKINEYRNMITNYFSDGIFIFLYLSYNKIIHVIISLILDRVAFVLVAHI